MRIPGKMSCSVLAAALVLALAGCGVEVAPPEKSSTADVRDRAFAHLKTLEAEAAKGEVNLPDLRNLVVSLKYLVGHMRKEKVGTAEQLESLEALGQRLAETAAGPAAVPPADWRPGEGKAPPAPRLDPAPLKDLLPRIRTTLESVR